MGGMTITSNGKLVNFNGLEALEGIGINLSVKYNDKLDNFQGLEQLTTLNGELEVRENSQVTSLSGLNNLDPDHLNALRITSNPLLSECSILSICQFLNQSWYPGDIYDNAPNCNSIEVVKEICDTLALDNINITRNISISPNPAVSSITVDIPGIPGRYDITIINIYGDQVIAIKCSGPNEIINIQMIPPGVYLMKVSDEQSVRYVKFIRKN